jgi:hypothetical protein
MQIMLWVAGMQRDVARRHRQHILDQRARKADAPVIALNRPGRRSASPPRWRRLAQPDLLQRLQRRCMDLGCTPASVSGLYCPPGMPGRTGRIIHRSAVLRASPRARLAPSAPAPARFGSQSLLRCSSLVLP